LGDGQCRDSVAFLFVEGALGGAGGKRNLLPGSSEIPDREMKG